MKGSPAIGTRLLNGLELKHQSRFGLDCLNDHSIAEDLSRLLVERTSRGVEASNCTSISLAPRRRSRYKFVIPKNKATSGVVLGGEPIPESLSGAVVSFKP